MDFGLLLLGCLALLLIVLAVAFHLFIGALWFVETLLEIVSTPPFHWLLLPFYLTYKVIAGGLSLLIRLCRLALSV
jgi:hypothetical protein